MPMVDARDLLSHAREHGYAVPACPVDDIATLSAAIATAEAHAAPLVLTCAGGPALAPLLAAMEAAAVAAAVPLAIQFADPADPAVATRAINGGCNAVRVAANADSAPAVIALAAGCGVAVEAVVTEATVIPPDGVDSVGLRLDPGGGVERLAVLAEGRHVPLAIDNADVLADAAIPALVAAGVTRLAGSAPKRLIGLGGAAGQAEAALAACRVWRPVEHLIVYNVDGLDAKAARAMIDDGARVLGAIPGVRRVFCGEAVKDGDAYRYCWLVRFVHPAVIDSYRHHPDHVAFADTRFRPVAGGRISIDYAHLAGC